MATIGASYFVRDDPRYDHWVATHQARTRADKIRVVLLHLAPGAFGWLSVKVLIPWLIPATGMAPHWLQLILLGSMAILWELTMPFVWLRRAGLTFRESLESLGLTTFDWKGVVVGVPLAIIAFSVLAYPYLAYGYEPVRAWLDKWSLIHMPPWHILYYGYYNYPALALIPVLIGNFLGEEVYFRGYLQKRLGWLGPTRAALVGTFLFCSYHLWQAPVNWAYWPVFFLIPFGYLMAWRKSLWVTIAFHVVINFGASEWLVDSLRHWLSR